MPLHLRWRVCRWQEGLTLGWDATNQFLSWAPFNSQAPMVRQHNVSQIAVMPLQAMSTLALPVDPATVATVPLPQQLVLAVLQRAICCVQEATHFVEDTMEAPFIVRRTGTLQVEVLRVQL